MPGLLPSGAVMAVVAYGRVDRATGFSPDQNSGHYTTARTAEGRYTLTPTEHGEILTRKNAQCIIQIQNFDFGTTVIVSFDNSTPPTGVISLRCQNIDDEDQDIDFTFLVLRSTITPPVGSPA